MAHDQKRKRQADENLNLPLRLGAMIRPIGDAVCVGDWVVGYQPPGDEHGWIPDQWYDFGGSPPQDWLSAMVIHARSHQPHAEVVRRFLMRDGTFREWDWVTVEKALRSGVPDEVKEEIRRSGMMAKAEVYLLQVAAFYHEWRLLKSLALMAGNLAESSSPLRARPDAEEASQLLKEAEVYDFLPPTKVLIGHTRTQGSPYRSLPVPTQARLVITGVFGSAFGRALRDCQYRPYWGKYEGGPRIAIQVQSVLGIAYHALLANFARGWKRCKRPDCGNIFPRTEDKRKVFCSQYCGHLVSLRRKRAAKRKRTSKRKGGKR